MEHLEVMCSIWTADEYKHQMCKVKKIMSMVNLNDTQIVFKGGIKTLENNDGENVCFNIQQVTHSAVIQTNDDVIRHCICYIDNDYLSCENKWMDIDYSVGEDFRLINYKDYLTQMDYLKIKPLDYVNYIAQQFNDDCIPPYFIELDCKVGDFEKKLGESTPIPIIKTDAFGKPLDNNRII